MPRSTPSPLLIAAGLLLAAVLGTANAQPSREEVDGVAGEVLKHDSWLADLQKCPTDVIAEKEDRGYLQGNACTPGELGTCLARCAATDAGACYWLGYELQQAQALPRASELLYQRSCKLGVVSGCTNRAAGMLNARPRDTQVQSCTAATFAKTCSFDDPWGCTMYGMQLSRGLGVAQDNELALKVLEKSCKYGADDPACSSGVQLRDEILAKHRAETRDK